jgi:tripartite-type tricarboxylate transporter receptor subunit TctC
MRKLKNLIILLLLFGTTTVAKENVTIVYAFSPSDPMANYTRTLIEEANSVQKKYYFIFDAKPGAGGSIASRYVESRPDTILAASSAFFVRPIVYPAESHSTDNFRSLMLQCRSPMAIGSVRYKTWAEVPRDQLLNIGISGLGVVSHLTSIQITNLYPNIQPVPFKSTNDATLALLGNQIDLSVGFLGDLRQWKNRIHVLGITGTREIDNVPTLKSAKFAVTEFMDQTHHLVASKRVAQSTFTEWQGILYQAALAQSVQESYTIDYCTALSMTPGQAQAWYNNQVDFWKKISSTVRLPK